jgi:chaperonin GroES
MNAGMDLAMQIQHGKNFPWPNCSNVIFPLITIAALQFSARSYTNIIQGTDIVRYRVTNTDENGLLRDQADRISRHMSWQVLEEDTAWEQEHDRLLINLGIVGTNFIKTSYSASQRCIISELVMARDFVLDYYAKSVESCARKTQVIPLYRNEIYERVKSKVFRDILAEDWYVGSRQQITTTTQSDHRQGMDPPVFEDEAPFRTLEQHRFLDLDKDGYAEPYVVTIDELSHKVLRIAARFDKEEDVERTTSKEILRIRPMEYYTKYSFIPAPDGGIYDVGFGILLGPLNEAVNSGINQLLDSGTMQNSMGGFLGRGAKIRGGVYTMAPWEWKRVDSTGDDLRKSMIPYPERQPSAVMFNLLGLLIQYTDRISGTTDPMVGENVGQNTPAETSRSMIEQGSQIYNMVFKRVWRSLKEEFKKRHVLNGIFLNSTKKFGTGGSFVRREDYISNPDLVVPSADPNVTSTAMRVQQAAGLRQAAMQVPGYDIPEVERNFIRALRIEGIDKFYPGADKVPPLPNPKAQLEEMKLKGKAMQFQHEKQLFVLGLMEERRLNNAKIVQLQAQTVSLIENVGVSQAALQIQAFDSAVAALQSHNDMLNSNIETMSGGNEDDTGGGVPPMAGPPSNQGLPGGAVGMAGDLEGPMGGGPVAE